MSAGRRDNPWHARRRRAGDVARARYVELCGREPDPATQEAIDAGIREAVTVTFTIQQIEWLRMSIYPDMPYLAARHLIVCAACDEGLSVHTQPLFRDDDGDA